MKKIFFLFLRLVFGVVLIKAFLKDIDQSYTRMVRAERQLEVMMKWMNLENAPIQIQDYLCNSNISCVAIYGMGFIGQHLYKILKPSKKIRVIYGLDRNANNITSDLKLYSLEKVPAWEEEADAIIVSVCYGCGNIVRDLKERNSHTKVLLLEKMLDDIRCR